MAKYKLSLELSNGVVLDAGEFEVPQGENGADVSHVTKGNVVSVSDSADAPVQSLKIFGKTTQNGTPSPDSPVPLESVGDSGSICVTVLGKNLFDPKFFIDNGWTEANGVYSGQCHLLNGKKLYPSFKNNVRYTVSFKSKGSDVKEISLEVSFTYTDGTKKIIYLSSSSAEKEYTLTSDENKTVECVGFSYSAYQMAYLWDVQLEEGTVATSYEPYKGQTLTVQTPNGLPGIPVASGGNYTDENGQQWVCDEIDFDRGMLVQRVGSVDLGTLPVTMYSVAQGNLFRFSFGSIKLYADGFSLPPVLCPNYPTVPQQERRDKTITMPINTAAIDIIDSGYTNAEAFKAAMSGVKILYARAIPTETPLSADELSAFAALRTKAPNTTVYNDAGANMEVGYATELSALPIAGGRMGGNLGMSGNRITDVGAPVADGDAVSKAYVDGLVGSGNDLVEDSEHPGCYYRMVDGVKEWLNPPGVVGVAYRTTERYKGYPVWVKTVYIGDSVANTPVSVGFLTYEVDFFLNCVEPFRTHASTLSGGDFGYAQTIPNVVAYAEDGMFDYYVEVTTEFDARYIFATVWYITYD